MPCSVAWDDAQDWREHIRHWCNVAGALAVRQPSPAAVGAPARWAWRTTAPIWYCSTLGLACSAPWCATTPTWYCSMLSSVRRATVVMVSRLLKGNLPYAVSPGPGTRRAQRRGTRQGAEGGHEAGGVGSWSSELACVEGCRCTGQPTDRETSPGAPACPPESMMASAPSRTAIAMSDTSALQAQQAALVPRS